MDYNPPINGDAGDDDRGYINGDPVLQIEGSIPSATAIEHPQREILAVITAAGIVPDAGDLTQLLQAISSLSVTRNVGDFFWHIGATAPANAISPNGATGLSRAAYPAFFAHLSAESLIVAEGTKEDWEFGDGDGVTTFSLGDWRNKFIRSMDGVGRVLGSFQEDTLQNITGTFVARASSGGAFTQSGSGLDSNQGSNTDNRTITFDASNVARTSDETRPANIALLPCIQI